MNRIIEYPSRNARKATSQLSPSFKSGTVNTNMDSNCISRYMCRSFECVKLHFFFCKIASPKKFTVSRYEAAVPPAAVTSTIVHVIRVNGSLFVRIPKKISVNKLKNNNTYYVPKNAPYIKSR